MSNSTRLTLPHYLPGIRKLSVHTSSLARFSFLLWTFTLLALPLDDSWHNSLYIAWSRHSTKNIINQDVSMNACLAVNFNCSLPLIDLESKSGSTVSHIWLIEYDIDRG